MTNAHTAFIFDLDGTLLDTLPDLVALTNKALVDCGFPERSEAQILSYVGNGARALMLQAVPQDATQAQVDEAVARWKELYPEYGYTYTAPYKGMPGALDALKREGVRLAVLSNKFDKATRTVIDMFYPGVFEVVHGECADIPRKPDPTGLLKTIAQLGATAETSVYVGDSPGDMLVAHNAGVFALAVSWGYRSVEDLREADCAALIHKPEDLLEHL